MVSDYSVKVKLLFALVAHEPIGISPFVSLFAGDAKLFVASAAGHQHLAGNHLAIVDRVHYFVVLIHLIYFVVLSLTH